MPIYRPALYHPIFHLPSISLFHISTANFGIIRDASVEGGATSIQMMSAKIVQVDDARAELSATVTQQLADAKVETAQSVADMQTEMATQAQEVTDQLAETREQVNEDLSAAVETSKNYADNAIENTVTPALTKVASDLIALETKIKKDIDEDIKTTLDKYEKVLMGTSVRKFRAFSPPPKNFIKKIDPLPCLRCFFFGRLHHVGVLCFTKSNMNVLHPTKRNERTSSSPLF